MICVSPSEPGVDFNPTEYAASANDFLIFNGVFVLPDSVSFSNIPVDNLPKLNNSSWLNPDISAYLGKLSFNDLTNLLLIGLSVLIKSLLSSKANCCFC